MVLLIIIFLAIMGYELPGILRNGWWGSSSSLSFCLPLLLPWACCK